MFIRIFTKVIHVGIVEEEIQLMELIQRKPMGIIMISISFDKDWINLSYALAQGRLNDAVIIAKGSILLASLHHTLSHQDCIELYDSRIDSKMFARIVHHLLVW